MVTGVFSPGETILGEDGGTLKIAVENTVSHFICVKRGDSYNVGNPVISLDGVEYPRSAIEMAIQGSGAISRVYVKDRTAVTQIFSQPPVVEVGGVSPTPLNQATIVPVLFRNTVYTLSLIHI